MIDVPLLPPKSQMGYANHHWVRRIDFDGRPCGLEVYQWQPSAQKWCLPNEYACNRDKDLAGYSYVALCPTPPFAEEVEIVRQIVGKIPTASQDHDTFHRLIREHLYVLPKEK